jgi:hypothetical protein
MEDDVVAREFFLFILFLSFSSHSVFSSEEHAPGNGGQSCA